MARTTPLSRLAALSAASRRAGELGIDVPELLGRQAEVLESDEGLTRRDLLKRAAVAGAGLTVAGRLVLHPERAAAAGRGRQPRIAIVGAGISGMTAAMTLKDAGFTNDHRLRGKRPRRRPHRTRAKTTASGRPASGANGAASSSTPSTSS